MGGAHETVMSNSPATLDLEERAGRFTPPLLSALVAPLLRDGKAVGALSVYATSANPFNDDHQYALERVAATLVECVQIDPVMVKVRASAAGAAEFLRAPLVRQARICPQQGQRVSPG